MWDACWDVVPVTLLVASFTFFGYIFMFIYVVRFKIKIKK